MIILIDDILVYSPDEESHQEHMRVVLDTLWKNQLYAKFLKCDFWMQEVTFVGHIISEGDISVDLEEIRGVQEWKQSRSVRNMRSFLGLIGYCHQIMPEFSLLASLLTQVTIGVKLQFRLAHVTGVFRI